MEVILLLAAAGVGGFYLLRGNTHRGAELVRAHVYMDVIEAGGTWDAAIQVANVDVLNFPTMIVINAKARLQRDFGGKQAAMIAFAYGLGMPSKLPGWYRAAIIRAYPQPVVGL